jgi:hypothetical protein
MMQEAALAPELRVREHIDLVCQYYPSPMTADQAMGCLDVMCKDGATCNFMDYIDRIPMRRL